ncbi:MAG: GNAT family N-acetyltransferase [Sulfitobacter sp.]
MELSVFRWATSQDYDVLGRVMFDAVHKGSSPYSDSQRRAWIAEPRSGDVWNERLANQDVLLAEMENEIVAFMSLAKNEYLDFAYILPAYRGHGLFRQLYERIEERAVELGHLRIWVHASLMAAPAFERMGFERLKRESVQLGVQRLDRFEMEKHLS